MNPNRWLSNEGGAQGRAGEPLAETTAYTKVREKILPLTQNGKFSRLPHPPPDEERPPTRRVMDGQKHFEKLAPDLASTADHSAQALNHGFLTAVVALRRTLEALARDVEPPFGEAEPIIHRAIALADELSGDPDIEDDEPELEDDDRELEPAGDL